MEHWWNDTDRKTYPWAFVVRGQYRCASWHGHAHEMREQYMFRSCTYIRGGGLYFLRV